MHLQPAHLGRIDLLAELARLTVHFFAFYPVDRSIEVGIGELGFQRRLFLVPLGQLNRLREPGPAHLLYDSAKPHPGGNAPLRLTPLQLLDRLA